MQMDEIAGIPFVCLFDAVYIHFREIKLRLSSKCSGSSEVLCAWVTVYWCEAANVRASFAAWGKTERKRSASCGDACAMS
jgi:hypothetical protein